MNAVELDIILQKNKIVVVDFFASWCGPCKMLSPIIHELSEEIKDVTFIKVDVDQEVELARKFNVMSIPTVYLFKDGKQISSFMGFRPKEAIVQWIKTNA
ncbi:MAG: thioredoxin [Mycoplasmataceae bacterium]|nr:thioredoxin [Mycoplasmataceae bacterium]